MFKNLKKDIEGINKYILSFEIFYSFFSYNLI
jgi:hypothetical protein